MTDRPHRGPIDYQRLGEYLRALSVPTRILLLHKLQLPRAPSEIELPPFRKAREHRDDRPISRQGVEKHLKKLEDVGLVRSRASTREGQPVREYLVNPSRLFMLVDELRRLSLLQPSPAAGGGWTRTGGEATVTGSGPGEPARLPEGPSLVLVTGPSEGTVFPLEGPGPWTVGRAGGVAVKVPHDPYVSGENSEITAGEGSFAVRDLPRSTNGTTLNWALLKGHEPEPLACGDTVGVGRSLFVFRQASKAPGRPTR